LLGEFLIDEFHSTKDNYIHRGVVQSDLFLCVGGCGKEETINHFFIGCDYFFWCLGSCFTVVANSLCLIRHWWSCSAIWRL